MSKSSADQYDESYFLRGKESGKSLYTDYRWLAELTIPMVQRITEHCGMERGQTILDFGCARGYVVRAMRGLGYDAWGMDISKWAIENADKEAAPYLIHSKSVPPEIDTEYDWIIAKDVLEHAEYVGRTITELMSSVAKGIFVVVPLSEFDKGQYVIEEYEKDVTHIHRYTLQTWASMFIEPGWRTELSYRVAGVKDNYFKPGWDMGNGFIVARRIEE